MLCYVTPPVTYATQSLVYIVPRQEDARVIIYALASGLAYEASPDLTRVGLTRLIGPSSERHLWTISPHPAAPSRKLISISTAAAGGPGENTTVVWEVDAGGGGCAGGLRAGLGHGAGGGDCVFGIRLARGYPNSTSLLCAFSFT